jgi:roadblock/LC7 domain-containing protein
VSIGQIAGQNFGPSHSFRENQSVDESRVRLKEPNMTMPRFNSLGNLIREKLSRRTLLGPLAGGGLAAAALALIDQVPGVSLAHLPGTKVGLKQKPLLEIEQLGAMTGVALAVEWDANGHLITFESTRRIPRGVAESAAQYGAAISHVAPGLAELYANSTGFQWSPYQALVVCGGDWAAVVGSNNKGVWVKASQADFNQLIAKMSETGEQD